MKKLVIIFVVSASTDMIVIILQGRDELMTVLDKDLYDD